MVPGPIPVSAIRREASRMGVGEDAVVKIVRTMDQEYLSIANEKG